MYVLCVQETSSGTMNVRESTLLKVILCSGLYPQVAIPDEHNSYKSGSEQIFHTKVRLGLEIFLFDAWPLKV